MEKVFDRTTAFKNIDQAAKRMADAHYNSCLY